MLFQNTNFCILTGSRWSEQVTFKYGTELSEKSYYRDIWWKKMIWKTIKGGGHLDVDLLSMGKNSKYASMNGEYWGMARVVGDKAFIGFTVIYGELDTFARFWIEK